MAADLEIEAFSAELCKRMWDVLYEVQIFYPPRKRYYYSEIPEAYEVSNEVFYAVMTRVKLFQNGLGHKFQMDFPRFSKSGIHFYFYLEHCFYKFTDNLDIFDKFLYVCFLTSLMGAICFVNQCDLYIEIAPLCCAMCIDIELKDEFYKAGGWEELRRHSSTYEGILNNVEILSWSTDVEIAFQVFNEVSKNYNMKLINDYYFERWAKISEQGKELDLCSKCSLLSSAFSLFLIPDAYSDFDTNNIECLLQLALTMKSVEKECIDVSSVTEELCKLSISSECSDDSTLNLKTNLQKQDSGDRTSSDSDQMLTKKLFRKLFGNPGMVESLEKIPIDPNFFLCMLCLKTKRHSGLEVRILEQEQLVLSNIKREIKFSVRKFPAGISEPKIVHPHPVKVKETQKDENEDCEVENKPEDGQMMNEQKRKLRMFIALGTEPAKSLILKESNIPDSEKIETQEPKAGTSKRKKKKKKSKGTAEK